MQGRTAIILAGGKGLRIGKTIKAFLLLGNKTLIEHTVESIQPIVDQVILAIGRDSSEEKFREALPKSIEICRDEGEREGALIGIITGLKKAKFDYSLILPCDSPFIKKEVIELLFSEALDMEAAIPLWPNGFIEPLHAVYKTKIALEKAQRALEGGIRVSDMIKLLKKIRYIPIETIRKIDRELSTFHNINTLKDLEEAKKIYSR